MLFHCLLVPVGRLLCDWLVLSVDRSDEKLPFVSLLLLLLGEVLSGLAVFGGLVGRRGLGGMLSIDCILFHTGCRVWAMDAPPGTINSPQGCHPDSHSNRTEGGR